MKNFPTYKKMLFVFTGPAIALVAYLILYTNFASLPGREGVLTFGQLFLVIFFVIFAWNFILYYMLFKEHKNRDSFEQEQQSFLSQAGHQLRTPLTSIRWSLEMLMKGDVGPVSQDQKNILEKICHEADVLSGLIKKLLIIDHLESNRQSVKKEPVSIQEVISEVLKEHDVASNGENLKRIQVIPPPAPLPNVTADLDMVREVIFNLISNALHYSPVDALVTVQSEIKNNDVVVSVADKGVGISPDLRDKLFTKFSRGQNTDGKNPNGIGLGLYIVSSFVQLLGGKLWFTSGPGQGTTFSFSLPLAKANIAS